MSVSIDMSRRKMLAIANLSDSALVLPEGTIVGYAYEPTIKPDILGDIKPSNIRPEEPKAPVAAILEEDIKPEEPKTSIESSAENLLSQIKLKIKKLEKAHPITSFYETNKTEGLLSEEDLLRVKRLSLIHI